MERDELLMKITEVEFACVDMQLYLNTHPCDEQAISKFNEFAGEAKTLREEYEKHFGPLFSYISLSSENYFSWIEEPWPWERDFLSKTRVRPMEEDFSSKPNDWSRDKDNLAKANDWVQEANPAKIKGAQKHVDL